MNYWPGGRIKTKDAAGNDREEAIWTYTPLDSVEACKKQFDIWNWNYNGQLVEAWVTIENHGQEIWRKYFTKEWTLAYEVPVTGGKE